MSLSGVFCTTAMETATADKDVATFKQMRVKSQQAGNKDAVKLVALYIYELGLGLDPKHRVIHF